MLDNVTGIIISAADLRSAPEEVRNWVLGLTPQPVAEAEPTPEAVSVEPTPAPEPAPDPEPEFTMPKFIEEAKAFMAEHGPPAMLALLREAGAERVSQCTTEQAIQITEGMRSHVAQ